MKKVLSFVLAFVAMLSLFSFAGCSDGSEDKTSAYQEKIAKLEEETKELEKQNKDLAALLDELKKSNEALDGDLSTILDELKKSNTLLSDALNTKYENIILTTKNYDDYISVNAYITDATVREENDSFVLSFVCHIETHSKIPGAIFSASLDFKTSYLSDWEHEVVMPWLELSADGDAHGSIYFQKKQSHSIVEFPTVYFGTFVAQSIYGTVLVPKEA